MGSSYLIYSNVLSFQSTDLSYPHVIMLKSKSLEVFCLVFYCIRVKHTFLAFASTNAQRLVVNRSAVELQAG